ncbi:MAG TPA: N-acetylmuramoyl-L-alanine amidase [Acidimicrobiales bacterium]|nr:N-acetylmuramoyl-L-alanine amidase [Acidimicrobiales bacterium]
MARRSLVTVAAAAALAAAALAGVPVPAAATAPSARPAPAAATAPSARPASAAAAPSARLVSAARSAPSSAAVRAANVGAAVPVAAAPAGAGRGFWLASTDGAVTPEGGAAGLGDASGLALAAPVVSIAATPGGNGYWLLGADGGVFSYGDAAFHGSTGGMRLNQPALQIVADPAGGGYWFAARDGGVFTFGDAGFYGSTGGMRLNQPVVGMAATPSGRGYWLVARDGGVFAFGDAGFYGSSGSQALPAPVIGMVAAGAGYWTVLGNGQVRAFGAAPAVASPPVATAGYSMVGQVIGIDPGHNGGNGSDPAFLAQPVWNGRTWENCDTTGTETDAGYTEAAFNFDVATRLAAILRSWGATVVMTRTSNSGLGPCVDQRAAILDQAGSDAALDIHADGGPPGGQGVAVLEPVADGPNDGVIAASDRLASIVLSQFQAATGEPVSSYDGVNGLQPRSDLAGLNLTTVPKVLIEAANMRNSADAARLTDPAWRQAAAGGLARALSQYLLGFP